MTEDEIIKQNRDTLLERMNESGNAYSNDEYPYGLMGEAEEENAQLRKERDAAQREVKFFDTALHIAAGLISTMPQYESTHPEEVLEMLKKTSQAMDNIAKLDEELGL